MDWYWVVAVGAIGIGLGILLTMAYLVWYLTVRDGGIWR